MPSLSRTGLRLPSHATMDWARISRSAPLSTSRTVAVTPLASCSKPTSSVEYSKRAPSSRALQLNRLQHLLGHEQAARRAHFLNAVVDVGNVVRDFAPGQCLDVVEPAVGVVEREGRGAHLLLDAGFAHQLHGAQLKIAGAGMDRGAAVLFDRQALDAVAGQEHRGRQADEAAADDEHGHICCGAGAALGGRGHRHLLRCEWADRDPAGSRPGWARRTVRTP